MLPSDEDDFATMLQHLQCQFLCAFPLSGIDWQPLSRHTSWEKQKQLADSTCGHPLNQQQPVKINYQLNFLKRLLQNLERHCSEVHDELYEAYCELQQKSASAEEEKFAFKHYVLPTFQTHFTLRESKSFVTEGTTGLCSWQASLALADFLLHNPSIVQGKSVLELGAGTGLCGFIISRCCRAQNVCLTDGSMECVELMRENVRRNFLEATEDDRCSFRIQSHPDPQVLTCLQLPWDSIEEWNVERSIKPDVILAADVVYDTTVLPELSHAVDYIFKLMANQTKMLLAATVRNEETLSEFLKLLDTLGFDVVEEDVIAPEKSHLFWDRSTLVKIFQITR